MKKLRQAREARQKRAKTQYNINDETGTYIKIDNKPNTRNGLLDDLRTSIKPFKNVNVKLSMKTGSRRLISALVSNRFRRVMGPRATRRAKRRAIRRATRRAKTI